jgi:hypothetical protein
MLSALGFCNETQEEDEADAAGAPPTLTPLAAGERDEDDDEADSNNNRIGAATVKASGACWSRWRRDRGIRRRPVHTPRERRSSAGSHHRLLLNDRSTRMNQ